MHRQLHFEYEAEAIDHSILFSKLQGLLSTRDTEQLQQAAVYRRLSSR
jgi:hypothetical protein